MNKLSINLLIDNVIEQHSHTDWRGIAIASFSDIKQSVIILHTYIFYIHYFTQT